MRNCPAFEELNRLVDGELGNGRELEVRRHLDGCDSCAKMWRALIRLKPALGAGYHSASPPVAVRQAITTLVRTRRRWRRWWPFGLAALLLVAVGTLVFHSGQRPRPWSCLGNPSRLTRLRGTGTWYV